MGEGTLLQPVSLNAGCRQAPVSGKEASDQPFTIFHVALVEKRVAASVGRGGQLDSNSAKASRIEGPAPLLIAANRMPESGGDCQGMIRTAARGVASRWAPAGLSSGAGEAWQWNVDKGMRLGDTGKVASRITLAGRPWRRSGTYRRDKRSPPFRRSGSCRKRRRLRRGRRAPVG